MEFLKKKPFVEVIFLTLISAIVYLPYAAELTYYLDDWYYIYDGLIAGSNVFHSMFNIDRPARGYFFDIYFSFFWATSVSISFRSIFMAFACRVKRFLVVQYPLAK